MAMLREKAVKDLAQYNADVKELERVIAHEFNLKNFINTKSREQTTQLDDKMTPEQCKTMFSAQIKLCIISCLIMELEDALQESSGFMSQPEHSVCFIWFYVVDQYKVVHNCKVDRKLNIIFIYFFN